LEERSSNGPEEGEEKDEKKVEKKGKEDSIGKE
jgi:hypothetical protein